MGCTSSTEVYTDPNTGASKHKHKMGGSYPGNRRPQEQQYTPAASEFQNGQAVAHFVNYGGGNALVLQQNGIAQPQAGQPVASQPTYIQVTLPNNVHGGDKIHVQAPDGRLNEIIVPNGFGPGSTFTVEFADAPPPKKVLAPYVAYAAPVAQATTQPTINNTISSNYQTSSRHEDDDDGFASGFNNPHFVPTATAQPHGMDGDLTSSYPTAAYAKPVVY